MRRTPETRNFEPRPGLDAARGPGQAQGQGLAPAATCGHSLQPGAAEEKRRAIEDLLCGHGNRRPQLWRLATVG